MDETIYNGMFFLVGVVAGAGMYRFSDYYAVAKILQTQIQDFPTITREEIREAVARAVVNTEQEDAAQKK
jgi:uncharacterized protein YneF (UPF0154 family)